MWWECSHCGSSVERPRRPLKCHSCGTAGPVFVRADEEEVQRQAVDNLAQSWFELGFTRAHEDSEGLLVAA